MSKAVRFKHHLRPIRVGEDLVFLVGEGEQFMLRGALYAQLAPLLDGSRGLEALMDELSADASPQEVLFALDTLRQRGYLTSADPGVPQTAAAFWEALDVDTEVAGSRLASTPVRVKATGGLDPRPFEEELLRAGVQVEPEGRAGAVFLLTEDYLSHELEAHNREALERGGPPWMPIKATGVIPWIGPMIRPKAGFCWACLAYRLRLNRPVDRFIEERADPARDRGISGAGVSRSSALAPPPAALAASRRAALSLAAVAVAQWIAGGLRGAVDSALFALDLRGFQLTPHPVVRRAECPACGDPGILTRRASRPLALEARPKRFTTDGGHRIATPEKTFEAISTQLLSPLTGIIHGIAAIDGSDAALRPVYGGVFPACPTSDSPSLSDFHQTSAGKGRTAAQAKVSALAEAIERWSAQFQGDEPRRAAKLADLGDLAVHPNDLLHYSEAQYRSRKASREMASDPRFRVPEPFHPEDEIEWTPVWSLTNQRLRYLPTAYCYNNYPLPPACKVFPNDSNGNAAGNCVEEAIVQGFLELVERDAAAIWWYSRSPRPGVDLGAFGEPYFPALEAHYREAGRAIWVLDITTDLRIPAFAALSHMPSGRITMGFGCHLDAKLGVQRALTELNQVILVERAEPGATSPQPTVEGQTYIVPDQAKKRRGAADYTPYHSGDLRDDVHYCVARAKDAGLETLVLDQSRSDVGLAVVKVTVPGLRHFWPRFGPGRLYEIPARLGWRPEILREEDLNPLPIFG